MVGWENSMKNKKVRNIVVLAMTIGILGAIGYLSFILNRGGTNAPTQIKKTKASAITYTTTVLLAMNTTPGPSLMPSDETSSLPEEQVPTEGAFPSPTTILISMASSSSSSAPEVVPTEEEIVPTTIIPTPTSTLLVYRNPTPTAFDLPIRNTGVSLEPTIPKPTTIPTIAAQTTDKLPETGNIQLSSILFIVAATTIFVAFLF